MMNSAFGLLLLAASASAHSIFQQIYVNGNSLGQKRGIRMPGNNNPITDVNSGSLACNNVAQGSSDIITVPAGAQVTVEWHQETNPAQWGTGDDPIATSHKGPVMTYLAAVGNASTTGTSGLAWFKIFEDGLNGGQWAVDKLNANRGKVSFTVPSCVKSGQYLLRNEIIALHSASSYPGAQFYMSCAQIQITNGGSLSPSTVSFPGAYRSSDPGVTVSIYPISNYQIPGPRPISCNGSQQPTSSGGNSQTQSSSNGGGNCAALYGQCGGQGYSGPTCCSSGTCKKSNDFYSQCL